eukprot:g5345.t1
MTTPDRVNSDFDLLEAMKRRGKIALPEERWGKARNDGSVAGGTSSSSSPSRKEATSAPIRIPDRHFATPTAKNSTRDKDEGSKMEGSTVCGGLAKEISGVTADKSRVFRVHRDKWWESLRSDIMDVHVRKAVQCDEAAYKSMGYFIDSLIVDWKEQLSSPLVSLDIEAYKHAERAHRWLQAALSAAGRTCGTNQRVYRKLKHIISALMSCRRFWIACGATCAVSKRLIGRGHVVHFGHDDDNGLDPFEVIRKLSMACLDIKRYEADEYYKREKIGSVLGKLQTAPDQELRQSNWSKWSKRFKTTSKMTSLDYELTCGPVEKRYRKELLAKAEHVDAAFQNLVFSLSKDIEGFDSFRAAAVKSLGRMKAKCYTDHALTMERPRGASNVDVVRCAVCFLTPEGLAAAYRAIDKTFAESGGVLRCKNGYLPSYDVSKTYSYRSMLVNVCYEGVVCEIQLVLKYFIGMRKFTHLYYKIVRADSFWALVTDLRPSATEVQDMPLPKGQVLPLSSFQSIKSIRSIMSSTPSSSGEDVLPRPSSGTTAPSAATSSSSTKREDGRRSSDRDSFYTHKIKMCFVGATGSGKQLLLRTAFGRLDVENFDGYLPTVMDTFPLKADVPKSGKTVNLVVSDACPSNVYKDLRLSTFKFQDIFVCLFSLTSRVTLDKLVDTIIPEVYSCSPSAILVVVGNFMGLRDDSNPKHVQTTEGVRRAKEAGAFAYCECCGTTGRGVKSFFDIAIEGSHERALAAERDEAMAARQTPKPCCAVS